LAPACARLGGCGRFAGGEGVQVLGSGHRSILFIVTRATGLDRSMPSIAMSIQEYVARTNVKLERDQFLFKKVLFIMFQ
jgi:hypothetical protein